MFGRLPGLVLLGAVIIVAIIVAAVVQGGSDCSNVSVMNCGGYGSAYTGHQ